MPRVFGSKMLCLDYLIKSFQQHSEMDTAISSVIQVGKLRLGELQ